MTSAINRSGRSPPTSANRRVKSATWFVVTVPNRRLIPDCDSTKIVRSLQFLLSTLTPMVESTPDAGALREGSLPVAHAAASSITPPTTNKRHIDPMSITHLRIRPGKAPSSWGSQHIVLNGVITAAARKDPWDKEAGDDIGRVRRAPTRVTVRVIRWSFYGEHR